MNEYFSIGQAAKQLGLSITPLRREKIKKT